MYDISWSTMLPALVDPQFEKKKEQITTNGDEKLYSPFKVQTKVRYLHSKHCDCTYHLFTQGFTNNRIKSSCVKEGPKNFIGKALLDALKTWMILWMNDRASSLV